MHILLIQIMRLGDAVQMIPVIHGIKEHFPEARIHVLASLVGRPVFERERLVEKVHVLHKIEIGDLLGVSQKGDLLAAAERLRSDLAPLREIQWDWVINFSFSFPSALICFLLDAVHYSGFIANKHRQYLSRENWFAYSLASFAHRRYSNFNWVDIDKRILGLAHTPSLPLIVPRAQNLQNTSDRLSRAGFPDRRIIGMHPGASGDHKRWPLEKFAHLGRRLIDHYGYSILIFGGPSEVGLGEELQTSLGQKAINLCGQTDLDDLCAYLRHCGLFIGNDTGPMHLAAAVGTRTMALYFNSHFMETGPYASGHIAVHPDLDCFPCQGIAQCAHKNCLERISPSVLEKVIAAQADPQKTTRVVLSDGDQAGVYISAFDPWQQLEWLPLNRRPLSLETIERLVLKTTWLYYTQADQDEENRGMEYLEKALADYDPPLDSPVLQADLTALMEKTVVFKKQLEATARDVLAMQAALLEVRPDQALLRQLGENLSRAEQTIASLDRRSCLGFIHELLVVFRENIEQGDLLQLAVKTGRVYHEIIQIIDLLLERTRLTVQLLQKLELAHSGVKLEKPPPSPLL